jgi:tricorn protease
MPLLTIRHAILAAALFITTAARAAEPGYYSQPALFGQRLVFVSEGDLWTATLGETSAASPIIAHRLTSSEGEESRPCISPDGNWIAFAGQYDGNVDVFVMPIDGGSPTRLTFHPDPDMPLGWTPDGKSVLFRSQRANPLGRWELYRVPASGGLPVRFNFGECSMAALSATGNRIAFTRWSNEHWTWKRYRGGTAPDIWIGDFSANTFRPLTTDPANDLFPMWVLGRVFFLSDRSGTANIFSDSPEGGDVKQHTKFAPVVGNPTAVEGYDVRWPSADAQLRGTRIAFAQAGALAVLDTANNSIRRLDIRLASDRVAARQRFGKPSDTISEFALLPDGKSLLVGTRGEVLSVPVEAGPVIQLTRTSHAREWGAAPLGKDRVALITDAAGEQQIAIAPADGSALPSLLTQDREAWLMPPTCSPDGNWIAFADKTLRLHVVHVPTMERRQVDQSEAWEITDYRFSPDSQWLAYVKPMPNGFGMIHIHALTTQRNFAVSDGLHNDSEPRWDPAGKYLYFLSKRHLDPVLGEHDFEHVFINATGVYAATLDKAAPPPLKNMARAAGFDLEKWASEDKKDGPEKKDEKADAPAAPDAQPAAPPQPWRMTIDTDGLAARVYELPIEAGNYRRLEAVRGALTYVSVPVEGLLTDDFGKPGIGRSNKTLHRYDLVEAEGKVLADKIAAYSLGPDMTTIAIADEAGLRVSSVSGGDGGKEPKKVAFDASNIRLDIRREWEQMFNEAWRLQRDFYWAPNYVGVDWPAMKTKYAALLPRVGTRHELNDLIGQMIGELGTSHTYIWGGEEPRKAKPVACGLLGADIEFDGRGFRIARIIPGQPWSSELISPLEAAHLNVREGHYILAINGVTLTPASNPLDLLQDQAQKNVRLTVSIDAAGAEKRTIEVKTLGSERALRYAAWVESNRREVERLSEGALGYLHIPDMGGEGLVAFSRLFYPQYTKKGLVVDIRDNGGGFVSQMIISRLARKVWAFMQPRHGVAERYPSKTLHGYAAVLIDQHAGSDGDIFPASFRLNNLGPLIGTRTWGGVVGIRGDKPFVDFGLSTQPEFAWWDPRSGWSIENEGVSPDIEVHITPEDRIAGRDPQLQKAVDWLLGKLKESPMELPPAPPWPVRAR